MDDDLIRKYYSGVFSALTNSGRQGILARCFGPLLATLAQRAAERRHARIRRGLLKADEHLGDLLAFSGSPE